MKESSSLRPSKDIVNTSPNVLKPSWSSRRWLILLVMVGVSINLAFLSISQRIPPKELGDQTDYLGYADSLIQEQEFVNDGQYSLRSPLYPVFIVAFRIIAGDSVTIAVAIGQILLNVGIVILLFQFGNKYTNRDVAILAAGAYAVYPEAAYYGTQMLNTILGIFLLVLLVVLMMPLILGRFSYRRAFIAGIIYGLGLLCDSKLLFILPFYVLSILWLHRRSLRAAIGCVAVLSFTALMTVLPWSLRNAHIHGRLVLTTTQGGINAYTAYNAINASTTNPYVPELAASLRSQAGTEEATDALGFRLAREYILTHPRETIQLLSIKSLLFFNPWRQGDGVLGIGFLLAEIGALAGTIILFRDWRKNIYLIHALLLPIVATGIINIAFQVYDRFRVPVLPFYLLLTGIALGSVLHKLWGKHFQSQSSSITVE